MSIIFEQKMETNVVMIDQDIGRALYSISIELVSARLLYSS